VNELARRSVLSIVELLLLLVAIGAIAFIIAPAHCTIIWGSPEFTGWVAPIANRLSQGMILYTDGGHSPMPPLSYVILELLCQGHSTWFAESVAIIAAQACMLLVIYAGMSLCLVKPIPFLTVLLSTPIYFSLQKRVFFDAMVQLWVAILAGVGSFSHALLSDETTEGRPPAIRSRFRIRKVLLLTVLAALSSQAFLTKQSTGLGCLLGIITVIATVPHYRTRTARFLTLLAFLLLSAVFFFATSLLLSPWVDVRGMFQDVLLTGSQPKGGLPTLWKNCFSYSLEILRRATLFGLFGILFLTGFGYALTRVSQPVKAGSGGHVLSTFSLSTHVLVFVGPLFVFCLESLLNGIPQVLDMELAVVRLVVLWSGLFIAFYVSIRGPHTDSSQVLWATGARHRFAAMFAVLFPAAFFHSLSVPDFRWIYDNNPLISVAIAGVIVALMRFLYAPPACACVSPHTLVGLLIVLLSCALWEPLVRPLKTCRSCDQEWTGIPYLRRARFSTDSENVRKLVLFVRELAPDPNVDRVLFLPSDPDVEAWLDRRPPKLSCAVVFADHYWDRYVDSDFQRLVRDPPKVIVVGPRNHWRSFAEWWSKNWGCARLMDLVIDKLLPARYEHRGTVAIPYAGTKDFIDVYARKDAAPTQGQAISP